MFNEPFTRSQGMNAGLTADDLRGPRFRTLFRGVYVAASTPDSLHLRALGALLLFPQGAMISHSTAARLWGLPVPVADVFVVVTDPAHRRRRGGVHVRVDTSLAGAGVPQGGLTLVPPLVMLSQLARSLSVAEWVAAADAALGRGLVSLEQLQGIRGCGRWPHLVRLGAESPMETRTRLGCHFAGLPEPEVNGWICDASGRPAWRGDLLYRHSRTVIEYDGRHHIEVKAQWHADLGRREKLESLGWRVIVLTADDLYRSPWSAMRRVHAALLERGEPGVPEQLHPGWRERLDQRA